jgi:hypothetical protein
MKIEAVYKKLKKYLSVNVNLDVSIFVNLRPLMKNFEIMKQLTTLLAIVLLATSCKTETKEQIKKEKFPETLGKVFDKHGGIDKWR